MEHKTRTDVTIADGSAAQFPMRINKFLAIAHVASRREADALIKTGMVQLNGRTAVLGDKVVRSDKVTVLIRGRAIRMKTYISYAKPRAVATLSKEHAEGLGRKAAKDRLFAVHDLDKNSEGIVLLTNDGRVQRAVAEHPPIEEFEVKTQEAITTSFTKKLLDVETVGGQSVHVRKARLLDEHRFVIALDSDENSVKAICENLHRTVIGLKRVRFASMTLRGVANGQWKELSGDAVVELLNSLGIAQEAAPDKA